MTAASRYLTSRAASAALAGVVLFACDRALLRGASQLGALGHVALWGAHTAVAAAWLLIGGAWVLIGRALGAVGGRRTWLAGLFPAIAGAWPMFVATEALLAGDWITKQRFAVVIKLGALAGGLGALYLVGWFYARAAREAPPAGPRRLLLPAALLLGAIGAATVDAVVLPGLYPALHIALYIACSLFAVLAMCRAADLGLGGVWPARVGAGLLLAGLSAALLVRGNARALSGGSRVAGLILPTLAEPTTVIAEELSAMDLRDGAASEARDTRAAVDALLDGRRDYNVLLVIVDTLRADALPPARDGKQAFDTTGDTPFLDAWIAQSFRFRHAYSQASRTKRSMPPTFRSIEANEDAERTGVPLAAEAADLGMLPVAVVPQYFLLPESEQVQHLLLGFDRVSFYEKNRQEQIVDRAREIFQGLEGRRFFSWIHFYNMHDPYFAGSPLGSAEGTTAERYRKALRWLDAQMAKLWADLEASGLAKSTIVVFTADHGENLDLDGEGKGHGGSVREAEVRVPLAVRIPGRPGREIDVVAGNIDIVPTVLDIAGAPPRAVHRGRSLLPILAGADDRNVPLYFESSTGGLQGVAVGRQKLVHRGARGVFHRYDLASDPGETIDLYDARGRADRALRRAMLQKNPGLFARELGRPAVRKKLLQRLSTVRADAQMSPALRLLLQLAALSKDPKALAQGERIFREARDIGVQIAAARHLSETDVPRWAQLITERLAELSGTPNERAFVEGLGSQGQREIALDRVADRLGQVAREAPEAWTPWLVLIRSWKKPADRFAAPLGAMISAFPEGPRSPDRTRTLMLVLECARSLPPEAATQPLAKAIRPMLDDSDPRVAAIATRAVGRLRAPETGSVLRDKLANAGLDVRVRQAILHALVDLEGSRAAPTLIQEGKNPLLTVDAIQLLGRIGGAEAVPFLNQVAQTHYNTYTRQEARKALERIQGER